MFLGQLGCGTTVVLAMPMMLLPCRASLLEVIDVLVNGPHKTPVEKEIEEEERLPLTRTTNGSSATPNYQSTTADPKKDASISQNGDDVSPKVHISDSVTIHYLSTFLIVVICYFVAVNVPGVAVVWSIIGCFMGYLLSFILPSMCYLNIQSRYPSHFLESRSWVWFSWILLVTSVTASIVCTIETVTRLSRSL
jgi:hypothetical protein